MEINSSQPGIQLKNEDRARHQFNYSSCPSQAWEPEIYPPPFVRGNLAWGVHWPWHKALAAANRI